MYFVVVGEEKKGPYTVGELRDLAAQGQLTTEDLLQTGDGQARVRAGLVVGIFGAAQPEPLPVVPEAPAEDEMASRRRFLWWAVGILVLVPVLACGLMAFSLLAVQKRNKEETAQAVSNLKNLMRATMAYAADHDDKLPPLSAGIYPNIVKSYAGTAPTANVGANRTEWMTSPDWSFAALGSIQFPDRTPLVYDSMPRRDGKTVVGMADGRVQVMEYSDFANALSSAENRRRAAIGKTRGPKAEFPQTTLAP